MRVRFRALDGALSEGDAAGADAAAVGAEGGGAGAGGAGAPHDTRPATPSESSHFMEAIMTHIGGALHTETRHSRKKPAMEAALAEATRIAIAAQAVVSADGVTTTDPGFAEAKKRIDALFALPELAVP